MWGDFLMRDLKRNQQTFYYAQFTGMEEITEPNSTVKTGERKKTYSTPVAMKANISPARGYADLKIFGKGLDYSKTICTCEMDCPITEESVLWIEKSPFGENNTTTSYNYIITQIARGLDNILYAVRKVDIG